MLLSCWFFSIKQFTIVVLASRWNPWLSFAEQLRWAQIMSVTYFATSRIAKRFEDPPFLSWTSRCSCGSDWLLCNNIYVCVKCSLVELPRILGLLLSHHHVSCLDGLGSLTWVQDGELSPLLTNAICLNKKTINGGVNSIPTIKWDLKKM